MCSMQTPQSRSDDVEPATPIISNLYARSDKLKPSATNDVAERVTDTPTSVARATSSKQKKKGRCTCLPCCSREERRPGSGKPNVCAQLPKDIASATCRFFRYFAKDLTCWQQFLVICFFICAMALSALMIKYHSSILEWVEDAAVYLQHHKWRGFLILAAATFSTAFPPVPGYSLCCYVAGYAFGMQGFFPVYIAAIVGAFTCFVIFRYYLVDCMFKWVAHNKQYVCDCAVVW